MSEGSKCEDAHSGRSGTGRLRHSLNRADGTYGKAKRFSDANGNALAVIVPIELWREIESERETAYLLKNETMKRRLLEAKERQQGLSFEEVRRSLEFDAAAFEDLAWWVQHDRKKALRSHRTHSRNATRPVHRQR